MEEKIAWLRSNKPTATKANELYELYDEYCEYFNTEVSFESYKRYCRSAVNPIEGVATDKNTVQLSEEIDTNKDTRTLVSKSSDIKTVEDLLAYAKVDLNMFEVSKAKVNSWGSEKTPMYQVTVELRRRASDDVDPAILADKFKELISGYEPPRIPGPVEKLKHERLAVLGIFDHHFGQLSASGLGEESYNLENAAELFTKAINYFISKTAGKVERYLFPIGQDLFNSDRTVEGVSTTHKGTPQDEVTPVELKTVKVVEKTITDAIDKLASIASVDVIMTPGNHDLTKTVMFGCLLEAYYRNTPHVTITNDGEKHHAYGYGQTYFFITHGDGLHQQAMPLLMVQFAPELFGKTKYHEILSGHLHNKSQTKYGVMKETMGIRHTVLPSLTMADRWHKSKGYVSVSESICFICDKEFGIVETHSFR